ncbi:MAG TPA: glycosyltransferase [Acidimicrobiia bacterium]|jgi:SAM-dependent methyltransferase
MTSGPHLSICIPSYNLEQWTADAVESALGIGGPDDVEVVVVDDGSTDSTVTTLRGFEGAPNFRLIQSPQNVGMVANFNRVVRASAGRWVTVLGADDELLPDYFKHLQPHLDRDDIAAVSQVAWMQWNSHETAFGPIETRTYDDVELAEMLGGAVCISTTAFRRDLFEAVGGFADDVGTVFDFDLFVRMCRSSALPVLALGESGGRYYPLRGSTWTTQLNSGEGSELLLRWLRLRAPELGPVTTRHLSQALSLRARAAGRQSLADGHSEAARRSFAVAISSSEGRELLKNRIGFAGAHLPAAVAQRAQRAYRSARASRSGSPSSHGWSSLTKYDVDRSEMLAYVPHGVDSVLEVGCASGRFGAALRARDPGMELVGVEPDPEARMHAAQEFDRVVGGMFPDNASEVERSGGFGVVVFNDVLEHMSDPEAALDAARRLLTEGGVVVASIPNVRHISVTRPLVLSGEWRYEDVGILDATHLRFFTEKSIRRFFADAGWTIDACDPINRCYRVNDPYTPRWIRALGRATGGRSDPFFVLQYAVVAKPNPAREPNGHSAY